MFANTCVRYGSRGAETATDARRGTAVAPHGPEIGSHPRTGRARSRRRRAVAERYQSTTGALRSFARAQPSTIGGHGHKYIYESTTGPSGRRFLLPAAVSGVSREFSPAWLPFGHFNRAFSEQRVTRSESKCPISPDVPGGSHRPLFGLPAGREHPQTSRSRTVELGRVPVQRWPPNTGPTTQHMDT